MPPALYFISYILILYLISYSLFLISYTLYLISYSLFLIPYSLFLIPYFLFLIPYSLFLIPLRWNPNRKGSARCRSRQAQNQAALR